MEGYLWILQTGHLPDPLVNFQRLSLLHHASSDILTKSFANLNEYDEIQVAQ